MKKQIYIIMAIIIAAILTNCNTKTNNNKEISVKSVKIEGNGAQIIFDTTKIILDTIDEESIGKCTFHYSNIGDQPLVLSNVITTCGCVQSNFSNEPLMPGLSDSISFELSIKQLGQFTKAVVVKSNAINQPASTLRMFGYVKEAKYKNVEQ